MLDICSFKPRIHAPDLKTVVAMKLVNHHHTTTSASHLLRRRQVFAALPRLSPQPIRRLAAAGSSPPNVIDGQWLGSDAFSQLNDRLDAAPLPLPSISRPLRVCLVRHGQSTWNAEGRIQGSSDLSVLSAKGVIQAEAARDMVGERIIFCAESHKGRFQVKDQDSALQKNRTIISFQCHV